MNINKYQQIFIFFISIISINSYISIGFTQEVVLDNQQTIEDLIEEIASNSDEELDYTTLFEDLNYFLNHPLNLNSATKSDLERLQFLNDFQINSILYYIEKNGYFLTIYELQLVYGFTVDIIEKILPFITVGKYEKDSGLSLKRALKYGRHQIFIRSHQILEEQKGYLPISDSAYLENPNSRYLGSPVKFYTRYKYNYKNRILWGITAEKDSGEEFFQGSQKNGYDFYSAHFQVKNIGAVKTLALGDYQLQFGQGLTLWSGMSFGKSSYVLNLNKKARGIKKYSSVDENMFLRGIGTTIRINNFDISGFYSKKKIDANIQVLDTLSEEIRVVSSFQATGLHSKPSELYDKDAIDETIIGGNVSFNQEYFNVGLTYAYYYFGADLEKNIVPYNQFDFRGSENFNIGLDYQLIVKNINFFGEVAMSQNKAIAYLNGALLHLAPQVSLSILHRNYQRNYQAYYSNAFSENTYNFNENGIYIGTEIHPVKQWKISAYYDTYSFPWLKYQVNAPSKGVDYLVQIDYSPLRKVEMYWRIKQEVKSKNATVETSSIKYLEDENILKLRYHLSYRVSKTIQLKNRLELVKYKKGENDVENGYLIYQDINYKSVKIPLSLSFRYGVFDTESYNSRIYAYENDVLYYSSFPAYYSKGTRTYIILKYTITKGIDIWLRCAQTYYTDKKTVSSGLNEIEGNKKSEVRAQIRFKF